MNKLKLKIRNIIAYTKARSPLQNKDNNRSRYNQEENEFLTHELYMFHAKNLVNNQLETFDKLKQYVTKKDRIKSEEEQNRIAASIYIKFKEVGFIDDDCKLLKGIDEAITEFVS